jgi:hypothetical protein
MAPTRVTSGRSSVQISDREGFLGGDCLARRRSPCYRQIIEDQSHTLRKTGNINTALGHGMVRGRCGGLSGRSERVFHRTHVDNLPKKEKPISIGICTAREMMGLVVFIGRGLWESARRDGAENVVAIWSVMSTKTFRSGLCTAWPTRVVPGYVSSVDPGPSGGVEDKGETRFTLTFIDGIWRSGWT